MLLLADWKECCVITGVPQSLAALLMTSGGWGILWYKEGGSHTAVCHIIMSCVGVCCFVAVGVYGIVGVAF